MAIARTGRFRPALGGHPSACHEAFPDGSLAQGRAPLLQIQRLGLVRIGADAELDIVQPGTALAEFYRLSIMITTWPLIAVGLLPAADTARLVARLEEQDFLGRGFAFIAPPRRALATQLMARQGHDRCVPAP